MFETYLLQSDRYMLSLYQCMDYAHAAEKMLDGKNVGVDNPAWQNGPFLSGGVGGAEISRIQPYCLKASKVLKNVVMYQLGPCPTVSENRGFKIGHESVRVKSTEIIPTVAINIQFALLEEYDHRLFSDYCTRNAIPADHRNAKRYERGPVGSRLESIQELTGNAIETKIENAYRSVSDFRNKLTHEPNCVCDQPIAAFDVYLTCQAIAYSLTEMLGADSSTELRKHRVEHWTKRLDAFLAGPAFA